MMILQSTQLTCHKTQHRKYDEASKNACATIDYWNDDGIPKNWQKNHTFSLHSLRFE